MVFERDGPPVPYVNQALETIRADGTWEKLVAEWLPAPPDFREIAP
jgi:ABC-type amino acid transport substrate-binding protein